MAAGRLLIFNPETDFALASGLKQYTSPANVTRMRRQLSLLPAIYGRPGDDILVDSDMDSAEIEALPYYDLARAKGIDIVSVIVRDYCTVDPWGWNYSLKTRLKHLGLPVRLLPSDDSLEALRRLSHRRLSIDFNREINRLTGLKTSIPTELSSADEAMRFGRMNPGAFFKLPWSSSGRGTLRAGHFTPAKESQWITGAIRRQGSILAEKPCFRTIDFATEWEVLSGVVRFLGLSLFSSTPDGGYLGNVIRTQRELAEVIDVSIPVPLQELIQAQKSAAERLIAPHYEGLFGIDCCSDGHDDLRPCLEINLRRTMGHVTLSLDPARCRLFFPVKHNITHPVR